MFKRADLKQPATRSSPLIGTGKPVAVGNPTDLVAKKSA